MTAQPATTRWHRNALRMHSVSEAATALGCPCSACEIERAREAGIVLVRGSTPEERAPRGAAASAATHESLYRVEVRR